MPRVVLDPSLGVVVSAFGISRRGASHRRAGAHCQDAHLLTDMSLAGYPMLLAAVADGHGSKQHDRSHVGAHLALQATLQSLGWLLLGVRQDAERIRDDASTEASSAPLETSSGIQAVPAEISSEAQRPSPRVDSELLDKETLVSNLSRTFREHFPRMICRAWRELNTSHGKSMGDSEEALSDPHFHKRYGTTLLVSALIGDAVLLAQIGDGDVALLDKGEDNAWRVSFPLASEDDLVAGETHSLCSEDAAKLFRTVIRPRNAVTMITLSTDGLGNAYEENEAFRNLLVRILGNMRAYGTKPATRVLPEYLDRFSDQGSGDDITLAGIYIERSESVEEADGNRADDFPVALAREKEARTS